jgi:hypothetical protein
MEKDTIQKRKPLPIPKTCLDGANFSGWYDDILAIDEDSMSVQYPGCRAATLGVIHRHRRIPHYLILYSRSQKRLLPVFVCGTQHVPRERVRVMIVAPVVKVSRYN